MAEWGICSSRTKQSKYINNTFYVKSVPRWCLGICSWAVGQFCVVFDRYSLAINFIWCMLVKNACLTFERIVEVEARPVLNWNVTQVLVEVFDKRTSMKDGTSHLVWRQTVVYWTADRLVCPSHAPHVLRTATHQHMHVFAMVITKALKKNSRHCRVRRHRCSPTINTVWQPIYLHFSTSTQIQTKASMNDEPLKSDERINLYAVTMKSTLSADEYCAQHVTAVNTYENS